MAEIATTVDELTGKVAIATGAANGIGRATAELFHARGAQVVAEDLDPAVEDLPDGIVPLVADTSQEETAVRAVALALEHFGTLDVLVNNAGRINYKPAVETTLDDWNWVMDTNVTGAFLHSREALKVMLPARSGSIVSVASYASYFAFPEIVPYCASKGALAQLTRALAVEAAPHRVRVNAIGSGDVVTNLLGTFRGDSVEFLTEHGKAAPLGRSAQPVEIAEIAAFLASERASFLVGSIVMADGGFSVQIQ
jgi:NAD(P)-dependent dehydrogenase (short-subunit alcohol dehydrogenase family)